MHAILPSSTSPKTQLSLSVSGTPGDGTATLTARLAHHPAFVVIGTSGARPAQGAQRGAVPACDVAVIVSDVRNGLNGETRRLASIACTIGVRHLVLAVNKLDLIDWSQDAFQAVAAAFGEFAAHFEPTSARAIPLSAASGDNVASSSANMPWYDGPTLVAHLETLQIDPARSTRALRLPIASVTRPDPDHRHYVGTIASGTLRRGDTVQVAVSGMTCLVDRILVEGADREQAVAGDTVAVGLAEHIDVGSGDVLATPEQRPQIAEQFAAHVAWMDKEPLFPGRDYTLKLGTREVTASVTTVKYRLDVDMLHHEVAHTLKHGEIGACTIAAARPLAIDDFADFPQSGSFVLCERYTGAVVAGGTVDFALRRGINVHLQQLSVNKSARASLKAQGPCILWFTGLSGAGKSTIANLVEGKLAASGHHTYLLDGDNVRHGLNKDLGFTAAARVENIRRVGEVAKLFVDAGLIVLCSFISPFRAERASVRGLVDEAEFIEIFVQAPLDVCERRDPKGLYAKSRAGRLPNFTGIDSPYEMPENPDLVLDTTSANADELAERVTALLKARGIVADLTPRQR